MKTFLVLGLGLVLNGKFLALTLSVDEEIELPEGVEPPTEKGVLITPMSPTNGIVLLSGAVWGESREDVEQMLKVSEKVMENTDFHEGRNIINVNEVVTKD